MIKQWCQTFAAQVTHSYNKGGSIKVTKMVLIGKPEVCTKATTNKLSLKNVIKSYHVTYNSYEKAFIITSPTKHYMQNASKWATLL